MKCTNCRGRGKVGVRCFGWNGSEFYDAQCQDCKGTGEVAQKYNYIFSLWPDESKQMPTELFNVFNLLETRVEMQFSEVEFELFRASLNRAGFTLRAIVRTLSVEPEEVC